MTDTAVDPCHGESVVVVSRLHGGHGVVKAVKPFGINLHPCRLDSLESECGFHYDARQSHTAGRGPEKIGVVIRADGDTPDRGDQRKRCDVGAEAAIAVVILAVHIGRDRPTHGDLPGPGRHRNEPAAWKRRADECIETHASTHFDQSRTGINDADGVKP